MAAIPFHSPTVNATAELLVGKAATLENMEASNIDATDVFIQLFDAVQVSDVTVGTTVPDYVLGVPAGDATKRGFRDAYWNPGLDFQKGIVIAATTTVGGNTAGATAAHVSASYS